MIYGNLPPTTNPNATGNFFNNFFTPTAGTSDDINNAVVGYFQELTGDAASGQTLAASVLFTASQQGITPMQLIDQFRALKPGELNAYLAMFLNINRAGTSLLGISNSPQTNKFITRAVLP
jgi:hypothetical protein